MSTLPPPIQLGVPIGGLNLKDALFGMGANHTPWAANWDFNEQSIKVRGGYRIHAACAGPVMGLGSYGARGNAAYKLFAYVFENPASRIYDVTSSTPVAAHTTGDDLADECYATHYAGRLGLVTEGPTANADRYYDGASWAALGFTYSGNPIGGRTLFSYKGRVFILSGNYVYYSSIVGGVTGAMDRLDLSSLCETGSLMWGGVLSSPGDNASQLYIVFGCSDGEILVYQGDHPGADTWAQVAKFKTAAPLSYNSAISFKNDIWVLTHAGIQSVRDLFEKSAETALQEGVSTNINPIWTKLTAAYGEHYSDRGISAAYWPEKNRLYVLIPASVSEAGTILTDYATMFVHNTITGSWGLHQIYCGQISTYYPHSVTYYNNGIYYASGNNVVKLDDAYGKDEKPDDPGVYLNFDIPLKSAFTNLGSEIRAKTLKGLEPVLKTEYSGATFGMKAAADFGRRTSARATVALQSGFNFPFYGAGVEGNYLQYQFDGTANGGTTNTTGLEVFSVGAVI